VQGQDPELPAGIFVDNIVLTAGGQVLLEDGAETGGEGWTLEGFTVIGAQQSAFYDNYYIASNREYISYDYYLKTGPYNFGWPNTRPDWVEHFPYQDGLLIWYWDTSFSDNDVGNHPGQGEILPIDAHPRAIARLDGQFWRGRIALYDATFRLQPADSFTLHSNDRPSYIRGQAAVPVFDDRRSYYDERTPYTGVIVPNAGVRIRVLEEIGTSVRIRITSTVEEG
jgi:immune inhibitor A